MTTDYLTSQNSLLLQDGIASGASKLAESGLPGLAIVVLASAVVWLTLKLIAIQNARLDDAKKNTTDMLSLYQKVEQIVDKVDAVADKLQDLIRELKK
jgi:hypothetical protein